MKITTLDGDKSYTLEYFIGLLQHIVDEHKDYKEKPMISFDAGYNNVSMEVHI